MNPEYISPLVLTKIPTLAYIYIYIRIYIECQLRKNIFLKQYQPFKSTRPATSAARYHVARDAPGLHGTARHLLQELQSAGPQRGTRAGTQQGVEADPGGNEGKT